jgi:hypothetical protein
VSIDAPTIEPHRLRDKGNAMSADQAAESAGPTVEARKGRWAVIVSRTIAVAVMVVAISGNYLVYFANFGELTDSGANPLPARMKFGLMFRECAQTVAFGAIALALSFVLPALYQRQRRSTS